MKIRRIRRASSDEWDRAAARCSHATFFHTRTWAELWVGQSGTTLEAIALRVEFEDGKAAVLPTCAVRRARGLLRHYESTVTGKYGGWVSEDELGAEHAAAFWKAITKLDIRLRQNPFDVTLNGCDVEWTSGDFTQALDLRLGFNAIVATWSKGHASGARKAQKAGILVEEASGPEAWAEYGILYGRSLERWGDAAQVRHPPRLFEALRDLRSSQVKLFLARDSSTAVAGAICLLHNHHVVYWHGASDDRAQSLRPTNLLQYEIIRRSCEAAYWWYDFNPSGGLAGVVDFKKSFGTRRLTSNIYDRQPCLSRLVTAAAKKWNRW